MNARGGQIFDYFKPYGSFISYVTSTTPPPLPPPPDLSHGVSCHPQKPARVITNKHESTLPMSSSSSNSSSNIRSSALVAAVAVGVVTLCIFLFRRIFRPPSRPVAAAEPAPPATVSTGSKNVTHNVVSAPKANEPHERLVTDVKKGASTTAFCLSCDGCTLATCSDVRPGVFAAFLHRS
jgi:hypothetical protein